MAQTTEEKTPGRRGPRTDLSPLGNAVSDRVQGLMAGYIDDRSEDVANLAQLRSGAGRTFGSCPNLWGMSLDPAEYDALWERPGERRTEEAEKAAEEAVHACLTLFALHQQSFRSHDQRMHSANRQGWGGLRRARHNVGWAVRGVMRSTMENPAEIDRPLHKRLRRAAEASSHAARVTELRHIVARLREGREPLDYGLLAEHLYLAQRPGGVDTVKDAWGHGFVSCVKKEGGSEPAGETGEQGTGRSGTAPGGD